MNYLYALSTEKMRPAVGIDVQNPRLSWKIHAEETGILQISYRIQVLCSCGKTVWDSEVVPSSAMTVRYAGETLRPAADYQWNVTVLLSNGETLTADGVPFTTGLLDSNLFEQAKWISFPHTEGFTKEMLPAFRREFSLTKPLSSAKLFITGCGIYAAYLNGERVSNLDERGQKHVNELTPGFTEASKRKLYHSYDVTHLLNAGANCLSAIVTTGWWSDSIVRSVGGFSALRALLLLNYTDGTCGTLATDESWKVSDEHPVKEASVYHGETYDARVPMDFVKPGFDDRTWGNAAESDDFKGVVTAHRGEPIVCREDLCRHAVKVYTYRGAKEASEDAYGTIDHVTSYPTAAFVLHAGETAVLDFGQNAAGREFFKVSGRAGTKITVRHGEMLNDGNGAHSRGCDGPEGSVYIQNMRSAKTTTNYIIGHDDTVEEYRPLYTFYGFRYVTVTADADVRFHDFTGEVLTSVGCDSGRLETDNEWVNQLISNGRWGMYSNYLSVPTDCPQRDERLGWMADAQIFSTAAQYYSTAVQSFFEKWMQDIRDVQHPHGEYNSVAPTGPYGGEGGALGWSDAGVLAPYYVWRMSGDTTIVEEHYDSMKLYMDDFLANRGTAGPLPCYGDWLSFEPNDEPLQVCLGVCYYAWDALLMSEMAEAIGKKDDAAHYGEIYESQKRYFIETYVHADGTVKLPQQTAALFALRLKLLPDESSVQAVIAQLLANFADKGDRLHTGILGTSVLLPTLSENGMTDMAYTLLLQDALPSWLYSVKAGATTIWERWNSYSVQDGFGDVNMNSFNHYAYGCVTEWMFAHMAGIRPLHAGFDAFLLAPQPDKRIGCVKAEYESVCGLIRSSWRYDGDTIVYECTVPANTTATLINPKNSEATTLPSGSYRFIW